MAGTTMLGQAACRRRSRNLHADLPQTDVDVRRGRDIIRALCPAHLQPSSQEVGRSATAQGQQDQRHCCPGQAARC